MSSDNFMEKSQIVVSSVIQADENGAYIQCTMKDFSVWRCDLEGENWKKIKPSDAELSEKFAIQHQKVIV